MSQVSIVDNTKKNSEIIDVGPEEYAELHELTTTEAERDLHRIGDIIEGVISDSFEKKNYESLVEIVNSDEYRRILLYSGEYAEVCMVVTIHENDGRFLDMADTMIDVICLYRSLKYALYRIEFINSDQEEKHLVNLIRSVGFSPTALAMTVRWVSYNVVKVYKHLAELFDANEMSEYSFELNKACYLYESEHNNADLS